MSALMTAAEKAMERTHLANPNTIPHITDPMGRHWRQPDVTKFVIDDKEALMTKADFNALSDYSCSMPTGVYVGKAWKCQRRDGWYLAWYGFSDKGPDYCSNNFRKITVI